MFDVLVYVYENYWRPDACPAPRQLRRKLSAVGFEPDEIQEALTWLEGLAGDSQAAEAQPAVAPTPRAVPSAGGDADGVDGAPTAAVIPLPAERPAAPSTPSLRIYTDEEQQILGDESIAFVRFLESTGVLTAPLREMVIDRALAVGAGPLALEEMKIIVLMVFWSRGVEPDSLIMDELFVAPDERTVH